MLEQTTSRERVHRRTMLRQEAKAIVSCESLELETTAAPGFHDITEEVCAVVADSGVSHGYVTVYSVHTTAAIRINENQPLLPPDMPRAGGRGGLGVSELQATSGGVAFLDGGDVPVDELQVCFCPDGSAEASGKIDVAGLSAKIVVKGTLDLSGDKPRIEIESVRAGSLPSAAPNPA